MAKTKRQIIEELRLIDIVVELVDARIPVASRNPDIGEITKNKKRVIALNKSDLADENESKKWLDYFKKQGVSAVITDSNTGKGVQNVIKEIENLMSEELTKMSGKGRIGKSIRIMVLGIPNVGKSSFINRIAGRSSLIVGNKPGVTRAKQWIRVNDKIELLDTPGVLWPKFESEEVALNLAYTGSIKDDVLEKIEVAYQLLKYLLENYREKLEKRYGLDIENINIKLYNGAEAYISNNIYELT